MIMALQDMGVNGSGVETRMRLTLEGDHTEPGREAVLVYHPSGLQPGLAYEEVAAADVLAFV